MTIKVSFVRIAAHFTVMAVWQLAANSATSRSKRSWCSMRPMCLAGARVTASAPGTCPAMNSPASGSVVVSSSPTKTSVGTLIPATRRGVVGDHAEHAPGQDVGPAVRHEPATKSSWPRVSLPENDDLCVDRCGRAVEIAHPVHQPDERPEGDRQIHQWDQHRLLDRRVESGHLRRPHGVGVGRVGQHQAGDPGVQLPGTPCRRSA